MARQNDPILDLGEGITVRQYRDTDVIPLSQHGNNKNIWLRLRDAFPHPYTETSAIGWITACRQPENLVASGPWTPERGSTGLMIPAHYAIAINGEPVGSIGLTFGRDVYFRTAELGYWLSESYWGCSIMSKVVPAFTQWTFATFGILVRLNAEVVEGNASSAALLSKAGFEVEGRRVNHACKMGVLQTTIEYGILRAA